MLVTDEDARYHDREGAESLDDGERREGARSWKLPLSSWLVAS